MLKARGDQFDDPRVPSPEDRSYRKKYPHLSAAMEELLLNFKEERRVRVPLDTSSFQFARKNPKVDRFRLSKHSLPQSRTREQSPSWFAQEQSRKQHELTEKTQQGST